MGGQRNFALNVAKWEDPPRIGRTLEKRFKMHDPNSKGSYHAEGTVQTFATDIWRTYKGILPGGRNNGKGTQRFNEAIVLQRCESNPIDGVVIYATLVEASTFPRDEVLQLLHRRQDLKLYLYDTRLRTDTLRVLSNEQALKWLPGALFDEANVAQLPAFDGTYDL